MKQFFFWFTCCLALSFSLRAQTKPVAANLQVLPPYSPFLSDYTAPESEQLRLSLLLQDLSEPSYRVRLRITIEGAGGIQLQTDPAFNPPPLLLQPGVPEILSGPDLAPYLQAEHLLFNGLSRQQYGRSGALPEGIYRFTVQALDYRRSDVVLSGAATATAWLQLLDPPRLNLPFSGATVLTSQPQNLAFSWSMLQPGSPNATQAPQYTLRLVEVRPEGRDPNEAMAAAQPFFETTTTQTSFQYGPDQPPLTLGMSYAWRVQVQPASPTLTKGRDLYKNNGYSPVSHFRYGAQDPLGAPDGIGVTVENERRARFQWNPVPLASGYLLQYRQAGQSPEGEWFPLTSPTNGVLLTDLKPDTPYEYRLQSTLDRFASAFSEIGTFRTPLRKPLVCGQAGAPTAPLSSKPLITGLPGDIWQVGAFPMTVREVSGSNGIFSGKGKVLVDYLGVNLEVNFTNLQVNDQRQVTKGNVYAASDGVAGLEGKARAQAQQYTADKEVSKQEQQLIGQIRQQNGDFKGEVVLISGAAITAVTTNADGSLTVTKADGSQQKVPPVTKPTLIADKEGNAYLADGKGNVTKQTAAVANNPTTPAATTPFQSLLTEVINELKATEKQAAQLKADSLKNVLNLAGEHLQTATPQASAPSAVAYRPAITSQATDTEVFDPTTVPELQNSATLALLKDHKQILQLDQQLQKVAQRLAQLDTWQTSAGLQALVQTLPKALSEAQLTDASQRTQVRAQLKKALEDQLKALGK